jgi:methionyl aminopeptidase
LTGIVIGVIEILSPAQLDRARDTGRLVGDILHAMKVRARVGTNLLDIDRWAKEMIVAAGAESCYVPTTRRRSVAGRSGTTSARRSTTAFSTASRATTGSLTAICSPSTSPSKLRGVAADAAISFVRR